MGAHPIALAVDVAHDAAVQVMVEHGATTNRVVADLPREPTPRFLVMTMELEGITFVTPGRQSSGSPQGDSVYARRSGAVGVV